MWFFQFTLKESDIGPDDELARAAASTPFEATNVIMHIEPTVKLSRKKVNTEWGKEEVYGKLKLLPLEGPKPFIQGTFNLPKIKVNV